MVIDPLWLMVCLLNVLKWLPAIQGMAYQASKNVMNLLQFTIHNRTSNYMDKICEDSEISECININGDYVLTSSVILNTTDSLK